MSYSVPGQTESLFRNGILNNPLIRKHLPAEIDEASQSVRFEGNDDPSIPINWRFAESISSLKGLEAALLNVLLKRKYGVEAKSVMINTDHSQLFFMSPFFNVIDTEGDALNFILTRSPEGSAKLAKYFPDYDKHRSMGSLHRGLATNIYKTKDDRFYHVHGSMNPDPTLEYLGLPSDHEPKDLEDAKAPFREAVSKFTAKELDTLANDKCRQAGTICLSVDEYHSSEHGRANTHVGLFDIHNIANTSQPSTWWPSTPQTSAKRPLAGLKVVDLTRVIASPAITRGLAEWGASIMRITAPHLADMSSLHPDLNYGKWNASLDLRQETDREKLRALIQDADVFVQGYRPGVLDKYGFGKDDVLKMCEKRERGMIYVQENCYGWNGPWAYRSGWQQISDACCGVSLEFGRAMGHEEPVTPVFPNSDYCTGICGVAAILIAIMRRGESGGSYVVDLALNYYNQWLVNSVGSYPAQVWSQLWKKNGNQIFHNDDSMMQLLPVYMQLLQQNAGAALFQPRFLHEVLQKNLGIKVKKTRPIVLYDNGEAEAGFNVGTRGNGSDEARWPEDLMVEVVG